MKRKNAIPLQSTGQYAGRGATTIINYERKYITGDDNALFVKVKKKVMTNFRNILDTAIRLRVLEMALRLSYLNIFWGGGGTRPQPLLRLAQSTLAKVSPTIKSRPDFS